jgi:hypothetical protein
MRMSRARTAKRTAVQGSFGAAGRTEELGVTDRAIRWTLEHLAWKVAGHAGRDGWVHEQHLEAPRGERVGAAWERVDDRGSLPVAMILVLAAGLVASALVTGTLGELGSSRTVQDQAQARAEAQAALADALFQMDQEGTSLQSFCVVPVGTSGTPCTQSRLLDGARISYLATVTSPTTYALGIEASVGAATVAAAATVTRKILDPLAIFAGNSVTFNGASGTYNVVATDQNGNPINAPADVGSDGRITCHGSGNYGTAQVTYHGGSSNCPSWVEESSAYAPQDPTATCPAPAATPPTPCMPNNSEPCPNSGVFSGTQSSPFVLEPGVYECFGTVTFSGTVVVDSSSKTNGGKVQIYVFPSSQTGQTAIEASGAVVNQYDTALEGSCAGQGTDACGDPTALQVYVAGPCSEADLGGATFDGYLYAPSCPMTLNGGQLTFDGAFVLEQLTVNGNPNLTVRYDSRMSALVPAVWQVSDWRWVPPSSVQIP